MSDTTRWVGLGAIAVMALTAACGPTVPASVAALDKAPGIANLIKERLRSELIKGQASPMPFNFPSRVRVLPYDYQSGLSASDKIVQLESLADALRKTPSIAKDASVLPDAYGDSVGASFDGLMNLRTTTRADAFVLVSGRSVFVEAPEKGVNFFEWLGHKSGYEAQVQLEALWLEAPSGRFLPSLQAAGKAGPDVVVPDDQSSSGTAYALKRTAETQAFKKLAEALISQLKAELAAQPAPTPTPSTTPSASPSTSPSPDPSPSESGNIVAEGGGN